MAYFRGFLLPKEKDRNCEDGLSDGESDGDYDDFENHDYHDLLRIAGGRSHFYTPSKIRQVAEKLRVLDYVNRGFVMKGIRVVRARFDPQFSHPWWMVELYELTSSSRSRRKESVPSYSIRCDDGVDASLLSLFLKKGCLVEQQHLTSLLEFIEIRNLKPALIDLVDNLQEFASTSESNRVIASQIRTSLLTSSTGKAFLTPELTKVVHRLLPHHVGNLYSSTNIAVLQKLNQALLTEPWVFGYQTIMKDKFSICGCEVTLSAFINCNLFKVMPVVQKDALYIYSVLNKVTYKYGHTYVPLWLLKHQKYYEVPFVPQSHRVTTWEESLAYLKEINAVKTSGDVGDGRSVFLPNVRGYEQAIARKISKVMTKKPWVGMIKLDEQMFGGDLDQLKAAQLITTSPVVVISGQGGCGKTFVVSTVLSKALRTEQGLVVQDEFMTAQDSNNGDDESSNKPCKDVILLTAPTGRAASILGRRTGLPSYTLHSVTYSYFHWLQKVKANGTDNSSPWEFSKVCLLVCDECSLISVKVFSTMINILMKSSCLQQLILLGDINQLPSIEPGNFLGDVYIALSSHGASVTLSNNHRSESQLIVENARRISFQEMPSFPNDLKRGFISLCCQFSGEDVAITQLVRDLLRNKIPSISLPPPDKSQFIAFRRNDCMNINELCAQYYNQHCIKDHRGKLDFRVGDKVCLRSNVSCYDCHKKEVVKLCNGEIFFIREIICEEDNRSKKTTYFEMNNGERIMKIDSKLLKRARLCHAWARTIHTFQGSEIDTVIYVVGSPVYQNWQHVYTAVTRGIRQVIVIREPNKLEAAVKSAPFKRKTKLAKFLQCNLQSAASLESDEEEENLGNGVQSQFSTTNSPSQSVDSGEISVGFGAVSDLDATHTGPLSDCLLQADVDEHRRREVYDAPQDEVFAWPLESNSPLLGLDSEDAIPAFSAVTSHLHPGTSGAGIVEDDFLIRRKNLTVKRERRVSETTTTLETFILPASKADPESTGSSTAIGTDGEGTNTTVDTRWLADTAASSDVLNHGSASALTDSESRDTGVRRVEHHGTFPKSSIFLSPPKTPPFVGEIKLSSYDSSPDYLPCKRLRWTRSTVQSLSQTPSNSVKKLYFLDSPSSPDL